jgi:hypothetical protein
MARLTAPVSAAPGEVIRLVGISFDPREKFRLTTKDSAGVESGFYPDGHPSNENRPGPDGSFVVGIKAPPALGQASVIAYQAGAQVAAAPVMVRIPPALPFSLPFRLPAGDAT